MTFDQLFTNGHFYSAAITLIGLIVLLVLITRRAQYSPTIRWLQVLICCPIVVSAGKLLSYFGQSAAMFDVAQNLIATGIILAAPSSLCFTLYYVGKGAWLKRAWVVGPLALVTLLLLYLNFHTYGLLSRNPDLRELMSWGYAVEGVGGPQIWILSVFSLLGFIISTALLLQHYRRASTPSQKQQTRIILIGLFVPVVLGILIRILPNFGIHFLTGTDFHVAITVALFTYALLRYGTTAVDPGAIVASIVQTMNSAALALDIKGRIIFANQAAASFLGYTNDKLIGQDVQKLIAPAHWEAFNQSILHAAEAGKGNQTLESAVTTHDGTEIAINVYSSRSRDKAGHALGVILVFADIQRLKDLLLAAHRLTEALAAEKKSVEAKVISRTHELHEAQAKLRAAIESLPLGFILADGQGNIVVQNNPLFTIFNLASPVGTLKEIEDTFEGFKLDAARQKILTTGKPVEFKELSYGAKILRAFMGPVKITEAGHTGVIGTIVLLEDVTEEKVMARSKDEFFSIASHELRTPLTAIKGNTSMMLEFYADALKDPGLHEMVDDVHTSSVRLIEIVNDFLDLSRIEQGKITFKLQPVALDKAIEQVTYELEPVLKQKHLTLKVDDTIKQPGTIPPVYADPDRVKQVLYNLVGNAVKFTDEGGILIAARTEGDFVKVYVHDTGRGISTEGLKLLFHKFQQAGSSLLTRDTTRGTGLGLYISKLLLHGMHGDIGLENSVPGEGTTFFFSLPIVKATDPLQEATNAQTTAGTPVQVVASNASQLSAAPRILVFEDDPYVQRMYQRLFSFKNWQIELAASGEHGVDKVIVYKPDLVLLDLMMPKVDGLGLLKQLKSEPRTKDTPVLVITNIGEANTISAAKQLGASGYLVKADFAPDQLLDEIKKHLAGA